MNSKNKFLLIVTLAFSSVTGFAQTTGRETQAEYQGGFDRLNVMYEGNASNYGASYMQNLYYNSNSTGVGFYKTSNNALLLALLDNGKVGVGITDPSDALDVKGDIGMDLTGKVRFGRTATTGEGEYITNLTNVVGGSYGLSFCTSNIARIVILSNGNMGVSNYVPAERLDVNGNIKGNGNIYTSGNIYTTSGKVSIGITPGTEKLEVAGNIKSSGLIVSGVTKIFTNPANISKIVNQTQANGKKYSLFVDYGVVSEDFVIAAPATWSDYVFENDYKLRSLNSVESFITEHKHLPGIPAASEVKENGYGMHDMNTLFLQKIEELTLYAISQEKKIKELENTISTFNHLAAELQELKTEIEKNRK